MLWLALALLCALIPSGVALFRHWVQMKQEIAAAESRKLAAEKELERFAYTASHDLKEPLRMISTYLGLLSKEAAQLSEKEKTYLGYALEGSKRLHVLVESLLQFSRIGYDRRDLQPVDLNELVREVTSSLRGQIAEAGAQIHIDDLPVAWGDPNQLRQLFHNLLSNALKFRRADQKPQIRIQAKTKANQVEAVVSDDGLGIREEDHQRIFEIFRRLNKRSEYPGEGIGLALCQKIVQSHGGSIWVDSDLGKGASFHFTLPTTDSAFVSSPV